MTRRVRAAGVLLTCGVAIGVAKAELPRHVARPGTLPGIPCYDYKAATTPRPTVTAVSLVKVPGTLTPPPAVATTGTTTFAADAVRPAAVNPPQLYQMLEARLQADHCFLSRVAVAFHDDGAFQISFRADQNPQPSSDIRSPLKLGERLEIPLQTAQLKRNLFVVKVRGYASYPVKGTLPSQPNVPPVLVEFPLEPFWVQNAQPYSGFVTGRSDDVRRYFAAVDRIEVEFTYR